MIEKIKAALQVKTLFPLLAVCGILTWALAEKIIATGLLGQNENLSLFLSFLFLTIIGLLGLAVFSDVSTKEIAQETAMNTNKIKLEKSANAKAKIRGTGTEAEIKESEGAEIDVDTRDHTSPLDPEKKT